MFFVVWCFLKEYLCLLSLWQLQVSDIFADSSFKVFTDTLASGGVIKVLCVPSGVKSYSNTALKKGDIYNEAIKSGAKGLPFLKVLDDGNERKQAISIVVKGFVWLTTHWVCDFAYRGY